MYSEARKRKKRVPQPKKVKKPPPKFQKSVIPGLLRQTNSEKKVLFTGAADATNGLLAFNTTGSIICLNLIQVGSSMFNRIGRKIEMRSIRLKVKANTLGVTRNQIIPDSVKIMVVYDRQTNGANPTMTTIISDTEQTGANTTTFLSALNMNNRERFVTLIDHMMILPQANNAAGVLTNVWPDTCDIYMDEYRQLRGLTTHFGADSNPAVIGDITTGGLFLVTLGGFPAGMELFQGDWSVRLKYEDV